MNCIVLFYCNDSNFVLLMYGEPRAGNEQYVKQLQLQEDHFSYKE